MIETWTAHTVTIAGWGLWHYAGCAGSARLAAISSIRQGSLVARVPASALACWSRRSTAERSRHRPGRDPAHAVADRRGRDNAAGGRAGVGAGRNRTLALGICYDLGRVERSPTRAMDFTAAAERGDPWAMLNLGVALHHGEGGSLTCPAR